MARRSGGWSLTRDATTGIYGVRFRLHGTRRHLSTGERDPRAAREAAARIYAAALSGRRSSDPLTASRTPLADLAAEWIASLETTHDPETRDTYELYAGAHWLPCWSRLAEITTASAGDYARRRLAHALAPTVRKELSALRGFLAWCEDRGDLAEAPLVRGIPKSVTGTRSRYRPRKRAPVLLTADEAERVIAAMPERTSRGGTPRAWARVAWETALRRATLAALRAPEDYRRGASVLVVRAEADKSRFARVLPLTAAARAALDSVCPSSGRLFPVADYREHLKRAALAAGIDAARARALSAHDLRHSRITHAVSSPGASTAGVAYLAGHRLVSTTDLYAHPQLAAAEAALCAVEAGTGSGQTAKRARRGKR